MRQILKHVVFWAAFCATAAAHDVETLVESPPDRRAVRERLDATLNESLHQLMARHSECSDPIRQFSQQLQIQRDPSREYVVLSPLDVPKPSSDTDRKCLHRIARLRRQYAEQLARLADAAVEDRDFHDAYLLMHEVSLHDPTQKLAKTITQNRVHEQAEVKVKSGRTAYPEFGWRPREYSYVHSTNYLVVSNANKEDVIDLAKNLELLNSAWRQVFLEYWTEPAELSRIFSRRAPMRIPKHKFQIVLFATKQQYDDVIRRYERRARITQGIYIPQKRTAYFHAEETESSKSTWKHEATHQLFAETGRVRGEASLVDNFWLLEGLATYMESLQIRPGYSMVGGLEADRLQFARYRKLCGIGEFSLEELTGWGRWELQRHPDISSIYSQAGRVDTFFDSNAA